MYRQISGLITVSGHGYTISYQLNLPSKHYNMAFQPFSTVSLGRVRSKKSIIWPIEVIRRYQEIAGTLKVSNDIPKWSNPQKDSVLPLAFVACSEEYLDVSEFAIIMRTM